jgi:hypothetical protein
VTYLTINLQIIPLSKLGDEQFQDIKKLDSARPCLLTAESKKSEKDLVQRIKHGDSRISSLAQSKHLLKRSARL